jgi:hypothetical protein
MERIRKKILKRGGGGGGGGLIHYNLRPARLFVFVFRDIAVVFIPDSSLCNKCIGEICFLKTTIKSSILDVYMYITVANWLGRGVSHGIKPTWRYLLFCFGGSVYQQTVDILVVLTVLPVLLTSFVHTRQILYRPTCINKN